MIPRVAHFVYGLREQREPFHFLHYASLESCRRVLQPQTIYFHHRNLPWGEWWERIRPHLTLREVDHVEEVSTADYLLERVSDEYRYAHHADFIRLDALIEHGGVYADIDTIFLRPLAQELFDSPFVIGREPPVRDERTGELRPSLCNALMMAEPGASFAREWRAQMGKELNGTWSNHSGFLSERLSSELPDEVRVEPETRFFPFAPSRAGLSKLLQERVQPPEDASSVHLWAHLWWDRRRLDFSPAHADWCTPPLIRAARTTIADLLRPYLPDQARRPRRSARGGAKPGWGYLAMDEQSGYGTAAARCIAALEESGLELEWTPFIPGGAGRRHYQPALPLPGQAESAESSPEVLVAHLVPERLPSIRAQAPNPFLVAHTVWDTDRIPDHWVPCLNHADLIVVPSNFSADAIRASPVSTPVDVVPHVAPAIDDRSQISFSDIPDDVFVFYTIGEWNERNAVAKTVEAYLRAFTGDDSVLLVVKTSHRDQRHRAMTSRPAGPGTSAWSMANLLAGQKNPPAVSLITRSLTDAEIGALHRRGDCFVSLCRCEGFGLGAFDAAAHSTPVIITGFGGQLDYLGASPYLVDFELTAVSDPVGFPSYAPDQRWAEPDVDHAASLMGEVIRHRDDAAAQSELRAAEIRRRYGPQTIATTFCVAVERHRSRHPERSTAASH